MKIDIATHWRKLVIVGLVVALCIATWQCDRNEAKLDRIDATAARQRNISTAQAGRGEVAARDATLYPAIDSKNREIDRKRAEIRRGESRLPPTPRKETIQNEIETAEQGDINRLADMFRDDGYPCAVIRH